jgi:hypothetical protein
LWPPMREHPPPPEESMVMLLDKLIFVLETECS